MPTEVSAIFASSKAAPRIAVQGVPPLSYAADYKKWVGLLLLTDFCYVLILDLR